MSEVLMVVVVLVVVPAVVVAGLAVAVWRRLRRRNEVSIRRRTHPPLHWLASPAPCAQLHRRLRGAMRVLRQAVPAPRGRRRRDVSPAQALAAEIEAHAVTLDGQLLVAARLRGRSGTTLRRSLSTQVDELERAAQRLALTMARSTAVGTESTADALRRIAADLDATEAAWDEVEQIERDAGLGLGV